MARHVRAYVLPADLVARLDLATDNRSDTFRRALREAADDATVIVAALGRRLQCVSPEDDNGSRIGIATTDTFLEDLNTLAHRLRLPTEHVLRLALEAHLFRRGF